MMAAIQTGCQTGGVGQELVDAVGRQVRKRRREVIKEDRSRVLVHATTLSRRQGTVVFCRNTA